MEKANRSTARIIGYLFSLIIAFLFFIFLYKVWVCPFVVSGQPPFVVSHDTQIVVNEDNIIYGGSLVYFELRPINNFPAPVITSKLKPAEIGGSDYYFLNEEVIKAGRYAVVSKSSDQKVTLLFREETKVTIQSSDFSRINYGTVAVLFAFLMGFSLCLLVDKLTEKAK